FGAAEIGPLLSRHRKAWRRRTELAGRLAELEEILTERDRRGTALREALERIEQSDPQPGEDQALRTELERLGNAEELRAAASQAALALVGDEGPAAGALVDVAAELAGRAARTDPPWRRWGSGWMPPASSCRTWPQSSPAMPTASTAHRDAWTRPTSGSRSRPPWCGTSARCCPVPRDRPATSPGWSRPPAPPRSTSTATDAPARSARDRHASSSRPRPER